MTWEQYWYGDVWMVEGYRKADRNRTARTNMEAHLMGMYVYEAICDASPILHAFAKKGTKPIPFRTEPYPLKDQCELPEIEKEQKEENDRLKARVYMNQMLRAGKNWGKN